MKGNVIKAKNKFEVDSLKKENTVTEYKYSQLLYLLY